MTQSSKQGRYSASTEHPDHNYWIMYVDGTVKTFKADTKKAALHYFRMEGDRAFDFGEIE